MRKLLIAVLLLCVSAGALERQANADYRARRQRLAEATKGGLVLLFAATEAEGQNAVWGFHQDENFYYLSGWAEPGAALLIAPAAAGRPYTEILFLPNHNASQEKWTGPKLGPEEPQAAQVTGFDHVEALDMLRSEIARLAPGPAATVYSDLPAWDASSPSAPGPLDWLRRANAFPNYVAFRDLKPLLAELRVIKDAGEIALIRKATEASMAGHRAAMQALRPGMTEREISALMQYEFEKRGCERPAYAPIVGAGFHSTVLHYSENSGRIEDGDVVVMDVAGEYSMYASDITRTLPANGHFTARQREIYDIVLGAQRAAIAAFRSGKSTLARSGPDSLYQVAYEYINSHGKDLHGKRLGQYFIHGLSHYVGLEVHDAGDTTAPLEPGMVFTIEPGIYLPEEKLGVRIEDIFYVDQAGKLVDLTSALPHTADEVEKAMAQRP
ncbi:MAG TPA: Xaa-Pro aminopeptidase [Terriglobales bacterium]|nr:Xaa-Pro aminopeptidase [Terriglobales bacterium]